MPRSLSSHHIREFGSIGQPFYQPTTGFPPLAESTSDRSCPINRIGIEPPHEVLDHDEPAVVFRRRGTVTRELDAVPGERIALQGGQLFAQSELEAGADEPSGFDYVGGFAQQIHDPPRFACGDEHGAQQHHNDKQEG